MIKSHGSSSPKAFLIGDAAFGKDLETGYALSGYQGDQLKGFCTNASLSFHEFWQTLLIKQEPCDKSDILSAGNKELLPQYTPFLINEIMELNPHLLIPLGELSFQYLTGLSSIRKFRGSVVSTRGDLFPDGRSKKVLPILGPYPYLNQEYKLKYITAIDFGKVGKHLHEGPIPDNFYNIWVCKSSSALRNFIERAYPIAISKKYPLVFDIETYLGIPTCISFCFDGFESVCVPLLDLSLDFDTRGLMMDQVAKLLNSPIPKVNQNIKFDWTKIERWGFNVTNVVGDTMLAASTLYCEFPKNLGFLTSIYTDLPYFKDEGGKGQKKEKNEKKEKKEWNPNNMVGTRKDKFYLYNAKDSLATHQIYIKQLKEIEEQDVSYIYKSLIRCIPIYRKMENRGMRVDSKQREKLLAKYESLFEIEKMKLAKLVGVQYVNPLSHTQMRKLVYDVLGYKPVRGVGKTEKGEPKADEEALELLLIRGDAKRAPSTGPPILQSIINCRKLHKVIEILELPLYPDERFRCDYNLGGTETGRTSASETTDEIVLFIDKGKIKVENLGHSLQTIGKHGFSIEGITYGKDLRSMFVPTRGHSFVEVDLSGAEARVDRVLSGVFDMVVFDNPGIHKLTGSWVYNCLPSEIKKNILVEGVDRYHMSKTIRHAAERNMGAGRMAAMTGRPLKECDRLLTTFHKFQPEIKEVFHRDIIREIDKPGHVLIAPNGRRRDFFDRIDKGTYNEGISQLPQAIVSDQTKFEGLLPTFELSDINEKFFLLAEMHDGILVETPKGREIEFAEIYVKNVEKEIDFRFGSLKRDFSLKIPAEVSVGEDWFELKEIKL